MILTLVVFLTVLSLLVLVHEFGHFIIAKKAGIGVLEFALGLPFTKPLWKKKLKSGMQIALYPVLFGGFVRLLGEEDDNKSVTQSPSLPAGKAGNSIKGRFFYKANVWQRIAVVVAGVTMNFLLAILFFYLFLGLSNFKILVPRLAEYNFLSPHDNRVVVTYVQKDSPAAKIGLEQGDVLLSVDDITFEKIADFQNYTKTKAGESIQIKTTDYQLQQTKTINIIPRKNPPAGQGPLGIAIGEGIIVDFNKSLPDKLFSGLSYSADMLLYNIKVISHLVSQAFQTKNVTPLSQSVSGPVGIASAVGTILDLGGSKAVVAMLNFVGLLSLSLAFMNILPFPALDGGKLFLLLIEAVSRRKLSTRKENLINQAGMAVLLGLIILISASDVKKVLTDSGVLR